MTVGATAEQFANTWNAITQSARELGRDPGEMESTIYFNLNIDDDEQAAYDESKRFLDEYYSSDWPQWKVNVWTACGGADRCIQRIKAFADAGAHTMVIRFTSYDQPTQLKRFLDKVAPAIM